MSQRGSPRAHTTLGFVSFGCGGTSNVVFDVTSTRADQMLEASDWVHELGASASVQLVEGHRWRASG